MRIALDTFSPVIEVEKPGCAYIDVTGVENEQELASELISSVFTGTGLKANIGITSGKFFSLAAALISKPEMLTIVPVGDDEKFIQPFSIDFLIELVQNAVDALDGKFNGSTTQTGEKPEIEIVVNEKSGTVRVGDNGIGMDPDKARLVLCPNHELRQIFCGPSNICFLLFLAKERPRPCVQ